MLQLANDTHFAAERAVQVDRHANQVWVVSVKGTYRIAHQSPPELSSEQEPVCLVPQYVGDPGRSTMLRDFELPADHPGTTISVIGNAHAPHGEAVEWLKATIQVGPVVKSVLVVGDRFWVPARNTLMPTAPHPFVAMPVVYERAFGGSWGDEAQPNVYAQNPIGTGFVATPDDLPGKALPNIEDPGEVMSNWQSRPKPAGFAPIPPAWSPRKDYAGTFDERWQEERMPLWPDDFDTRFYLAAPPDQVSETPLRGGEEVRLTNMTPNGEMVFCLPRVQFTFRTVTTSGSFWHRAQMERIVIEPELAKMVIVWRTAVTCGNDARRIRMTAIDTKRVLR